MILPHRIRLEASSLCSLNCPSCPNNCNGTGSVIGKGYLKYGDFVALLDQNPFLREIELSNYGEMFLNPDLVLIMREAYERHLYLRADNGVNLNQTNPDQLEGLVKYGLRSITCSLDGATAESYHKYRVNGHFQKVIQHVKTINRLKDKYHSRYPVLTWQFIVFGHNQAEIPRARQMAGELGMRFSLKLSWDDQFSPPRNPVAIRREIGYASRLEYRERHGLDLAHRSCLQLWEQPQINWDGRVLGCSRNFWGEFQGNVFSDGLLPCLNSDGMQQARDALQGGSKPAEEIPCASCSIYLDRVATGKYIHQTRLFRITRWTYRKLRNQPWMPVLRRYLARRGI